MKNIDKEGKKETKLELSLIYGVHLSQILHHNGIFNLNRGRFALNECKSGVQIDSYFAQPNV